jgi:hypothetical protein
MNTTQSASSSGFPIAAQMLVVVTAEVSWPDQSQKTSSANSHPIRCSLGGIPHSGVWVVDSN